MSGRTADRRIPFEVLGNEPKPAGGDVQARPQQADPDAVSDLVARWTEALELIKQQQLVIRKLQDEAKAYDLNAPAFQQFVAIHHQNPHDGGKEQFESILQYALELGLRLDGLKMAETADVVPLFRPNEDNEGEAAAKDSRHSAEAARRRMLLKLLLRAGGGVAMAVLALAVI